MTELYIIRCVGIDNCYINTEFTDIRYSVIPTVFNDENDCHDAINELKSYLNECSLVAHEVEIIILDI